MQLPETTTQQNGYSRQAVMIANVLLEGPEHMDLDLGTEIEETLATDAQELQKAKTSGSACR